MTDKIEAALLKSVYETFEKQQQDNIILDLIKKQRQSNIVSGLLDGTIFLGDIECGDDIETPRCKYQKED